MKKIVISAIVVYFLCVLVLSQDSQHFQLLSAKLPDIYLSWQKCFLVKLFMERKFCKKMPLNSTYQQIHHLKKIKLNSIRNKLMQKTKVQVH